MRRLKRIGLIFSLLCIECIWINANVIYIDIYNRNFIAHYENKWNAIISDELKYFPISVKYRDQISFTNDFGANRNNNLHEGCDIVATEQDSGNIPIISATDGKITNLGWLYLGGYRIGITSRNGLYYYYAHFHSFNPNLYVGKEIKAGEFLGFMGNTGEGEEGTFGNFPVHLHFSIYITDKNGSEKSVNPYKFLLKLNRE